MYSKEKSKGNPNMTRVPKNPGLTDSPKKAGRPIGGTTCSVDWKKKTI